MRREKRFCPYCGERLRTKEAEGRTRLWCASEERFIYENPIPAATGIVLDEGGRVLLILRNIEPGKGRWALPGGFIEAGESPAEAARRELGEECGIRGIDPELVDIIYQESRFLNASLLIIGYSFGSFEGTPRPGDDAGDVGFFETSRLPRMAFESHVRLIGRFLKKRDERRRLWGDEGA